MEVWGGNRAVETSVVMPGLDAWIYSRPAREQTSDVGSDAGGGDVHYVSSCAGGAVTRMLVADIAGHGPAVADMARRLRKIMQRHIVQHEQTGFVRSLNREFGKLTEAQNQVGRFATAVAFTYDAPINRLLVCNAGHPPPVVFRKRESRWLPLSAPQQERVSNVPLGIIEGVEYEQFESPIEVGDLVLCYTDALTEARHGNDLLGQAGLLDLLAPRDAAHPQRLIPQLVAALSSGEWQIDDDFTILLFRPNGLRPSIPLVDHLLAPFRFAKGLVAARFESPPTVASR
jgi:serine phosphatase RsbU (regulator of sigma subunit)